MEKVSQQILIVDTDFVKRIESKMDSILSHLDQQPKDNAISFPEFCKLKGISRPTGYSWADRKLIKTEKRGGRVYVVSQTDEIKRYQRSPKATDTAS